MLSVPDTNKVPDDVKNKDSNMIGQEPSIRERLIEQINQLLCPPPSQAVTVMASNVEEETKTNADGSTTASDGIDKAIL